MKQRFNALDIRATVRNLNERLIGLRLQNIYDVNQKTFLLKFAKPDDKELVLIESGIRVHSTQFSREKQTTPSMFCAKLRKYLRTRRLTNVRQLGVDRVVDFEFAGGEKSLGYHIIAEFYSSGNIIFTDDKYQIIALLRVVKASETAKLTIGDTYNVQSALPDFPQLDVDKLRQVLRDAGPKDTLKKVLNVALEYGPAMTEHIILEAGLNPNMKVASEFDNSDGSPMLDALLAAFKQGDDMVASTKENIPKGYIVLLDDTKKVSKEGEEDAEEMEIYDEFHPYLYKQHASRKYKEFPTFDAAVDEFYSAIEAQKIELKARNQEEAALRKLEAVRLEQENRVQGLVAQQLTSTRKAQLIEYNLQMVDAAITIIRNAIASQMDWQDLSELVAEEKKKNNPIAQMIDGLKLETNQITLLLAEPEEEDDDDYDSDDSDEEEDEKEEKEPQCVKVDVEIGLTAFANARKYYEQKKTTASKHEKTIAASSKALKSAERKIKKDLKETRITTSINKIRKPFWFEKFLWFISTEGHLVIAGRDMQQNELLVKRYLRKDDVYVHADLHGAASVIVKNKPDCAGQPIPPSTLYQAGIMSVCQSKAWDAKIVTSAYWVYPDQVSKSAPTGEYLTTGSFMIRGKKNFLPPVQLVYGFGYLFKLDESSIGNHVSEKRTEEQQEAFEKEAKAEALAEDKARESRENENEAEEKDALSDEEDGGTSSQNGSATSSVKQGDGGSPRKDEDEDEDEEEDESSDSSDDEEAFPDTQLAAPAPLPTAEEKDEKWNKYDLADYGADNDADELPSFAQQGNTPSQRKKFVTAKERRQMKKGEKGEAPPAQSQKQAAPAKKEKQPPPAPVRGRKGKAKKMKEKYADQDEEERRIRMELLGSNKGPQPKGKKAKKEAKRKAEKEAREAEQAIKKAQEEREEKEVEAMSRPNNKKDKEDETETIRQMLKEENITMLEAEEAANLTNLDSLTATPLPEDIIHFAIPVCAPYNVVQKYKYRVKLTPGSLKRGKALKQAQSVFINAQDATAREKELIKGVPEQEAINTMMSKVKVSAPNLEASKRKKGKK
ncbi:fibronectin-binding protein A N-terminus-domain-containing protein [Syncephalastrum racemosum]|uniref:Fibronectin-binding protein A N-terminus-domain-containing protein n=1 Tax=Syncephalastrum racemosum TaxID=13706 RepID=A0A1X2H3L2_SYNRA|nr:fibronectin-binding protein A N-terminus-domain-containing protein [Syncephalastrum racemosum]